MTRSRARSRAVIAAVTAKSAISLWLAGPAAATHNSGHSDQGSSLEASANYGAYTTREDVDLATDCYQGDGENLRNSLTMYIRGAGGTAELVSVGTVHCADDPALQSGYRFYAASCFYPAGGGPCQLDVDDNGDFTFSGDNTYKIASTYNTGSGARTWSVYIDNSLVFTDVDPTAAQYEPNSFAQIEVVVKPEGRDLEMSNTLDDGLKYRVDEGGSWYIWDSDGCLTEGTVAANYLFADKSTWLRNVNIGGSQCNQ